MKSRLATFLQATLLLLVLLAVGVGFFTWRSFAVLKSQVAWVEHTYQTISTVQRVYTRLKDAETGERGYLLTHDKSYVLPYETGSRELLLMIDTLRQLTLDNSVQQKRIDSVRVNAIALLKSFEETLNSNADVTNKAQLRQLLDKSKRLMDQERAIVVRIGREEISLRAKRIKEQNIGTALTEKLIYSVLFIVVLLAASLGVYARSRLKQQQEFQRRLNEINEELSSTNEELAASNEEINSTNEELLSANEELVTSLNSLEEANRTIHSLREYEQTRSKTLFEAVVNNLPQIFYIYSADKRVIFANEAAVKAAKKPLDAMYGKLYNEVFPEIQVSRWETYFLDAYEKKSPQTLELSRVIQGEHQVLVIDFIPILNSNLEVDQVIGFAIDITQQKLNEIKIAKSLHEKEILLAEIHHRVKNNLSIISGLLQLQADRSEDKKLSLVLKESTNRIYAMSLIHEKLYQSDMLSRIDLSGYVRDLVSTIQLAFRRSNLELEVQYKIENIVVDIITAVPLCLILNELVTNAYKHAFEGRAHGLISIEIVEDDDQIKLTVSDNGVGLPFDFDPRLSTSLGWTLVDGLTRQLKGKLMVSRVPVTSFSLVFNPGHLNRISANAA